MANISYQLYCSRNFGPLDATCKMLADAGYSAVEGYGGLFADVDALKAALDGAGLAMPTSHIGLDLIIGDPDRTIEIAKTLGIGAVYAPFVGGVDRPTDEAGWSSFWAKLAEAAKPLRDAGIDVGWHNHDFEFQPLSSGAMPMELLDSAEVSIELDLGWVKRAGQDPVQWIQRLGPKLSAAHIKDLAPEGENADEDGWADVGHGTFDWSSTHAALKAAGVARYVIEHDNPSDDARFAQRSLAGINAVIGA